MLVGVAILDYVSEEPSRRTRAELDEHEQTDEEYTHQVIIRTAVVI